MRLTAFSDLPSGEHPCILFSKYHDKHRNPSKYLKLRDNTTLLSLPPYAPDLNPMENIWQYLRTNKLTITVFDTDDEILDKCSDAWNFFAKDPARINSITHRDWITVI